MPYAALATDYDGTIADGGVADDAAVASLARLRRHFGDELLTRAGNEYRLTPLAVQLRDLVRIALSGVERVFAAQTEFDPAAERLQTRVNGQVRQDAPLSDMIHSVAQIVAYASAVFTLLPGDVVLTGTPAGVGPVEAGDVVEVEITSIGILRNGVRDA